MVAVPEGAQRSDLPAAPVDTGALRRADNKQPAAVGKEPDVTEAHHMEVSPVCQLRQSACQSWYALSCTGIA
jgi:hypothetical protein